MLRATLARRGRRRLGRVWLPALAVALLLTTTAVGGENSLRVRIAWGGNVARLWQGTISIDDGSLSGVEPLGIEADEPGTMWLDGGYVQVRQRSPRFYDGLDLLVDAPADTARLRVSLAASDRPESPTVVDVPLRDILDESVSAELDNQGTRILVRRSPGDHLRVHFDRRALVFSPGEEFAFDVTPHLLAETKNTRRELKAHLLAARGEQVLWEQESIPLADEPATVPLRVPLRVAEGAYDVVLTVIQTPALRLPQVGEVPVGLKKVLAQRRVQLLVLGPRASSPSTGPEPGLTVVEEIDPANPRWWERFAKVSPPLTKLSLPKLPRFWQGPLGSEDLQTRQHPLGPLAELKPGAAAEHVSWEAYTLPIKRPGMPHVLEVDYPSDVAQTMGISVMEPNAAGTMMPIQLDSGVDVAEEVTGRGNGPPRMLRHRVIFWPRTEAPMVLITNRSQNRPAVYGKIRVLAGWNHLPRAFPAGDKPPERLMAAYLDRPLFPESFCASEALDAWSRRSLDDWVTFHEGGTRLVEYLHHVGMDGLMISALADGATIYPSAILEPTPRYDKGVFFATGQDPVRKDVLEMLFRLFDREKLQLIPAMEFATPLPAVEEALRRGGPESVGIEWVGPDGLTWQQAYRPNRKMAPVYNLLHPSVQQAMLDAAREVIENYAAKHESFSGLAIQLTGQGYAQLPGPEWGMDDVTIARFVREKGVAVPECSGPERFAKRWEFLLDRPESRDRPESPRRKWLEWRADCVSRFYQRLQAEVTASRKGARVYLATANLLSGPEWQQRLRPSLPRRMTMTDAMLEAGLDAAAYQQPDGPVLMHSERVAPLDSLAAGAMEMEMDQMADAAGRLQRLTDAGSLFYQTPRELRVESFDRKNPYRGSYTQLSSQLVPSAGRNRRRFVHALALLDSRMMFDGGELMPLGQEDAIRDLVAVYRQLPAIPLRRVSDEGTQPVTIRYGTHESKTYAYLVNDSPTAATVTLRVDAPADCRVETLAEAKPVPSLARSGGETTWTVTLKPYDLVGARLSSPDVTFSEPKVALPGEVQTALISRIRELGERAAALRNRLPLDVLVNPAFEQGSRENNRIPGWIVAPSEGTSAGLEETPDAGQTDKPAGSRSLRLQSAGSPIALMSEPFRPPTTGRLSMFVWLRVPRRRQAADARAAFDGQGRGREFLPRSAVLGRNGDVPAEKPIPDRWSFYVFPVDDLPLDGLSELQVGFRLTGPGEVWIDDVQLCHLEFNENELTQLSRMI